MVILIMAIYMLFDVIVVFFAKLNGSIYDAQILPLKSRIRVRYFRILYRYLIMKYLIYKVVVYYKKIFE